MPVRIRLEAADPAELDAHEAALRSVLTIPEPGSRDYPNRREPGRRRYLDSAGVRPVVPTVASRAATAPDTASNNASDEAPNDGGDDSPLAAAEQAKRRRDLGAEIATLRAADEDLRRRPWFPIQPGDVVLMHLPADAHSPAHGETYLAVDGQTDIAGNAMLREVSRTNDSDAADPEDGEPDPDYALRYDTALGRWRLDCAFMGYDGLDAANPWLTAPDHLTAEDVAAAQAWAAREIGDPDDPGADHVTGWREHTRGWAGWAAVFDSDLAAGGHSDPGLTPFYELWFEAGAGRLTVIRAGTVVHGRPAAAALVVAGKRA
jgi:hypothetical protein